MLRSIKTIYAIFLGKGHKKYVARYKLFSMLAEKLGFYIYARDLAWPSDAEFQQIWQQRLTNEKRKIYKMDRLFSLFYLAKAVQHLPGDLVECGLWKGDSSYTLLAATQATPEKQLYGFDSFEGLSEPTVEDQVKRNYLHQWKHGDFAEKQEVVERNLAVYGDRLQLYAGWIPTRFNEVADKQFCLVHLDVDLYEPTKAAAEFFYERLTPGGALVCDDYGALFCPGSTQAMDDFAQQVGRQVWHLPNGQGIIFK